MEPHRAPSHFRARHYPDQRSTAEPITQAEEQVFGWVVPVAGAVYRSDDPQGYRERCTNVLGTLARSVVRR